MKKQAQIESLPLMEAFHSIQGEGYHQGKPAWFIRLGGCDVGCSWCDVKDSWDASKHENISVEAIIDDAIKSNVEIIIITGGEPLMYNLDNLTEGLRKAGKKTHLETSGAYPLSGEWDWITFSPKKFKSPLAEFLDNSDELKVVIFNNSDFNWAETFAQKMNKRAKLYLQPEWTKAKKVIPLIVDYVKSNPNWEISLQIHKYMDIR